MRSDSLHVYSLSHGSSIHGYLISIVYIHSWGLPYKIRIDMLVVCQVLFSHAVLYLQSGSNSNAPELERDFPGVRSWLMHVSIITHVLNQ